MDPPGQTSLVKEHLSAARWAPSGDIHGQWPQPMARVLALVIEPSAVRVIRGRPSNAALYCR